MATIKAHGSQVTVTLVDHTDEDGDAYYTIECDRGAWCGVPAIEPKSVWNRDEAIEIMDMHADSLHA